MTWTFLVGCHCESVARTARLRRMKRIPSLDGLRAIAISLVVLGHWAEVNYQSPVAGAFASLGRRIFFVLSGCLITTLMMKKYGKTSTIRLRRFYLRRASRILPAAIAFMLPVFVIFWHDLRWYHMVAASFYVVNFDFSHPWFLGHLWSISVQEQFYFLWPSVLKSWYRCRLRIPVLVIAFAPLYRVACHFLRLHGRADEAFPAVADILAIGCLTAIFEKQMPKIKVWEAALMVLPIVLVPLHMGTLRFHTTPLLLFCLVARASSFDRGMADARGAETLLDSECAARGLAGKDQLWIVSVAAAICVRQSSSAVVFRAVCCRDGSRFLLSAGTTDAATERARDGEAKNCG